MKRTLAALAAACLALAACDAVEQVKDALDTRSGGDAAAGDATATGDATTTTPTDTATAADTAPAPNVNVTLTAQIRSVTANGQIYVEGNFTWSATGASDLRVDVQIKTQVSYPDWTNLLSNQAPVDVGTAGINGPDRRFNFRAVAYRASDPATKWYSAIVTIQ
ncbi:MAG: hypothetical protein H6745_20040 [Deltaproteobacteria bacterium]|nr:hypothetical protein [Deltaproteobacteria bacterium]